MNRGLAAMAHFSYVNGPKFESRRI